MGMTIQYVGIFHRHKTLHQAVAVAAVEVRLFHNQKLLPALSPGTFRQGKSQADLAQPSFCLTL